MDQDKIITIVIIAVAIIIVLATFSGLWWWSLKIFWWSKIIKIFQKTFDACAASTLKFPEKSTFIQAPDSTLILRYHEAWRKRFWSWFWVCCVMVVLWELIWRVTPVVASINVIRKKNFLLHDSGSGGWGFKSFRAHQIIHRY